MTQDNSAIVRRFVDEGHQSGENRLGRRVRLEGRGRAGSPPRPGPRARRNEGCSARYAIRVPRYRILHQGAGLRGRQGRERFEWTGTHKAEFMGVPATNCPRISAKASALTGSRSALKSSRSTAIGLRSTMSMTLVILVYPRRGRASDSAFDLSRRSCAGSIPKFRTVSAARASRASASSRLSTA